MKLIICMALLVGTFATAEDSAPIDNKKGPKIIYRKKTFIDFQDAVIEGQVDNPEGLYIVTPPEKKFGALLKLRPNFHRELMRDVLMLK